MRFLLSFLYYSKDFTTRCCLGSSRNGYYCGSGGCIFITYMLSGGSANELLPPIPSMLTSIPEFLFAKFFAFNLSNPLGECD